MKRIVIAGAVAAVIASLSACEADDDQAVADSSNSTATEQKATAEDTAEDADEVKLTAGQRNAIKSAENYLDTNAFSRSGLIKQLEFEGFSKKDATFAVDQIEVDWMEQAVKSAENYLETGSFSKSGLVTQLEFEGFTAAQARHGAEQAYK